MIMTLITNLQQLISNAIYSGFQIQLNLEEIELQPTPDNHKGDYTFSTFSLNKRLRKNPSEIAINLVAQIKPDENIKEVESVNAYLNITLQPKLILTLLHEILINRDFEPETLSKAKTILIEFSSPNTNKPLHLGHIRNNLIGNAVCNLYQAIGFKVIRANLVNDRGIHICKSMLAWQKWGKGETPESSGIKGDHFVGKYYVLFDKSYKKQVIELQNEGYSEEEAEKNASLMVEAQAMLKKWEDGDAKVVELWKMMNRWVYKGFDQTYRELGINFDLIEYESDTYQIGKSIVLENYKKGLVEKEADGSLWVDFTQQGLDRKLVLRSDGTSVYMTQDIGTAVNRKEKYNADKIIYVVAVEQQYHFKVLKLLLKHFGYDWYDDLYHLSYEMVALPSGRMKSREGTVVDADDLMREMTNHALEQLKVRENEQDINLAKIVGLGALKYHIIKVDPQKNMLFDPSKTIDFQGNSGAFIQYTHVRIKSILSKLEDDFPIYSMTYSEFYQINDDERKLILKMNSYKSTIELAALNFNPSLVANYLFDLSQLFNKFYQQHTVIVENLQLKLFRVQLCAAVANTLQQGAKILGITLPDKM